MTFGLCRRAAVLAAVMSLWASPAMPQAASPGQLSEAQQNEIYCVSERLVAADDAAYDVVEAYLYDDNSAEQIKRAETALKAASDACSVKYNWDASKQMLSEKINVYSLVADYLAGELSSDGLKEEQIGLIFTALGKLPKEDLPRFLNDSWLEDAEFKKRLNGVLVAAKFPGGDEYILETARLIMEATVLATKGLSDWTRQHGDKQ